MRLLIVFSLLAVAAVATASDLGSAAPAKRAPVVAPNVPNSARLAGDTVETAAVIGSMPFIDDWTTAGYNDDYYFDDACGVYVSRIDVVALPGGELESEPPLVDDYVDNHNGGCNTPPDFLFQDLRSIYGGELDLCGVSGWYSFQGSSYRDTDWFRIVMGYTGVVTAELSVEHDTYLFELGPQDCANVAVIQSATAQQLSPATMTITGYEFGEVVWIWVGPATFTPPFPDIHEYDYVLSLSGLDFPITVEATTWSTVKALYQ